VAQTASLRRLPWHLRLQEAISAVRHSLEQTEFILLNDAMVAQGGKEVPLAESTSATIEMMQEPEISVEAGMVSLSFRWFGSDMK